jgi:sugar-specific transcriptional regulator TrmB
MGSLIEEGCVRRTITAALLDSGLQKPFPLEGVPADLQENLKELQENAEKALSSHKHNTKNIQWFFSNKYNQIINNYTTLLKENDQSFPLAVPNPSYLIM